MQVANTLAYYDTATITAVKSFIVQAPAGGAVELYRNLSQLSFYENCVLNLYTYSVAPSIVTQYCNAWVFALSALISY